MRKLPVSILGVTQAMFASGEEITAGIVDYSEVSPSPKTCPSMTYASRLAGHAMSPALGLIAK